MRELIKEEAVIEMAHATIFYTQYTLIGTKGNSEAFIDLRGIIQP